MKEGSSVIIIVLSSPNKYRRGEMRKGGGAEKRSTDRNTFRKNGLDFWFERRRENNQGNCFKRYSIAWGKHQYPWGIPGRTPKLQEPAEKSGLQGGNEGKGKQGEDGALGWGPGRTKSKETPKTAGNRYINHEVVRGRTLQEGSSWSGRV